MGIIGLILAFAVLIYLIIRRDWSILTATIPASLIIILFDQMNVWTAFSSFYSAGVGSGMASYFLLLVFGALFGHMMGESGCALKIAHILIKLLGKERVGLTIFILTVVMVYGGISALVVVFTVGPIGLVMTKEAGLPRRFLFAAIIGGAGSLAMTSLPATPSLTNLIPTTYLGTTAMAAPVLGMISSVLQFILIVLYLKFIEKRYKKLGMGFEDVEGAKVFSMDDFSQEGLPNGAISFLPVVILIGFIVFLSTAIGGSTAAAVFGSALACIVIYALNYKRFRESLGRTVVAGAQGGVTASANLGAIVGFGVVVKNSSSFVLISDFCESLSTGGVIGTLFALFVAVSLFVGVCGSAAGGLEIFWEHLGERFVATGINIDVLHRISSITAGGFDSVPHNSAYPIFNVVLGTKFGHAYPHAVVTTLIIPVIAAFVCIFCAAIGIC